MAKTVFQVLKIGLDDQVKLVTESLTSGAAKDYAAYKEMCGVIRGLDFAHQAITDLEHKLHLGDDDD